MQFTIVLPLPCLVISGTPVHPSLLTCAGTSLLPSAARYAEAALQSPHQRLKRLGCHQIGRLLLATHDLQQQQQLQQLLVTALQVRWASRRALAAAWILQQSQRTMHGCRMLTSNTGSFCSVMFQVTGLQSLCFGVPVVC